MNNNNNNYNWNNNNRKIISKEQLNNGPCTVNLRFLVLPSSNKTYLWARFNKNWYSTLFSTGTCSVLANTNVKTFDGKEYEVYPKPCAYSLLRHCHASSFQFDLRIENKDCTLNDFTRYCKSQNVYLTLQAGKTIDIERTMNAKPVLTYDAAILGDQIVVEHDGGNVAMVSTPQFQLIVSGQNIYLTVNPGMMNKTCGLCGTFNRNSMDDYHLYNGGVAATAQTFLKNWLDPQLDDQPTCELGESGLGETEPTHSIDYCSIYSQPLQQSEERASVLKDPLGPFGKCLQSISPSSFFDKAKKTGCRHPESLCDVIAGYAKVCGDNGFTVSNWRGRIEGCPERKWSFYEHKL